MKCFWRDHVPSKIDPSNPYHHAHLLASTREEETQSGSEGVVYVARCGKEIDSWGIGSVPICKTGSLEEAVKAKVPICPDCVIR